jgi:hypothetical protein
MTLADLARLIGSTTETKIKWKLVWEFLEEYRWEPPSVQVQLVLDEPPPTGEERWDVLLAALAQHLLVQHGPRPSPMDRTTRAPPPVVPRRASSATRRRPRPLEAV